MTPQTAKAWHGFWVSIGIGFATALEAKLMTGLPVDAAAWRLLLNTCIAAALVGGIGWLIRRRPTTPPNGPS